MQSVLLVSPYFPPSTLAGVHRVRHLAKHLPAHGWRPIVIRVDDRFYSEPGEAGLAALVPEDLEQIRTGAVPTCVTRPIGFSDLGLRAFFHLRRSIKLAVDNWQPSAVLITGSPYYPMLLTQWLSRSLYTPVVLDFQDPWVSQYGASLQPWTKGGLAHRLALALEPRAVRHASFITSVSETQNAQMAERYKWLDPTRMAAITIGGDPDDFEALRGCRMLDRPNVELDLSLFNFSYVGTYLPRAAPLVREIFKALRVLKEEHPSIVRSLRINFVGTSNQTDYRGPELVMPLASELGVAELVRETPQRVPFLEALSILANSNGLLLIGSDEPHYTASKIYPALMSGKPYLSLFHSNSSAHRILSKAGGGRTVSFADSNELSRLGPVLSKALYEIFVEPTSLGNSNTVAYEEHTAHGVARQFAEIFGKIAK